MPVNHTQNLPYIFCFLIDFPRHEDGWDCESNGTTLVEPYYCVNCPYRGEYQLGGTVEDKSTSAHKISILIWVLTLIFGLFGTLGNTLIILILRRQPCGKPFEILLTRLACYDLICSIMSVLSTTGILTFIENLDRGKATLYWIFLTYFTTAFGRTGSTFMKALIAVERYIFIAHPENCTEWLNKIRTRLVSFGILVLTILLNVPRYSSVQVAPFNRNVKSLQKLNWIMEDTAVTEQSWFKNMRDVFLQVDFWAPFPILIIFSVLILLEIKKINKEKRELQVTRKKDIREVQMFVPVIIVLFICSILPAIQFTIMTHTKINYREQVLAVIFFLALSASLNLPIYCWKGSAFRKELRSIIFYLSRHQYDKGDKNGKDESVDMGDFTKYV